jgi:hypothetical protein
VYQAIELGPGEAEYFDQEVPDQALLSFAELLIAELAQCVLYPLLVFIPGGDVDIQRAGADQESADLVQGMEVLGLFFQDHHPLLIPKPGCSGSFPVGM